MLKKRDRLTARDIESLSLGKSVFGTLVSLRFSWTKKTKISVTVSKKGMPTAVERNRLRRRVYGAIEGVMSRIETPAFILVMPKKECVEIPSTAIASEIEKLLQKAGLLGR